MCFPCNLSLFPGQLHSFLLLVIYAPGIHSHEIALHAGAHACSCYGQGHMHFQKFHCPISHNTLQLKLMASALSPCYAVSLLRPLSPFPPSFPPFFPPPPSLLPLLFPSSPSSLFSSSVREVKYTYQSYSQRYHQLFALPLIVKVPRVGCTYTVFSTLPS